MRVCYLMTFFLLLASASAPALTPPTQDTPDGGAGSMVPFLALSTAALYMISRLRKCQDGWNKAGDLFMAGGLIVSAYFLVAEDNGLHPYRLSIVQELGVLLGMLGAGSIFVFLCLGWVWLFKK